MSGVIQIAKIHVFPNVVKVITYMVNYYANSSSTLCDLTPNYIELRDFEMNSCIFSWRNSGSFGAYDIKIQTQCDKGS